MYNNRFLDISSHFYVLYLYYTSPYQGLFNNYVTPRGWVLVHTNIFSYEKACNEMYFCTSDASKCMRFVRKRISLDATIETGLSLLQCYTLTVIESLTLHGRGWFKTSNFSVTSLLNSLLVYGGSYAKQFIN